MRARASDVITAEMRRTYLVASGHSEGDVDELFGLRLWLRRRTAGIPIDDVDRRWAFGEIGGREYLLEVGACLGCACTDDLACEGGCSWAEPNLCSECVA
jgi:hypothetical protein